MKLFNKIFCFLILFGLGSCVSNKNTRSENLIGKYAWAGIYGVGSVIELKSDTTFIFNWTAGLSNGTSEGTWSLRRNSVILNSYKQPWAAVGPKFDLIEEKIQESDTLTIKLIDEFNEIVPFALIGLKLGNDVDNPEQSDMDGVCRLFNVSADSLIIRAIGYRDIDYKLKPGTSYLKFKMESRDVYYRYFTDTKWKWKNNRLYDRTIHKDRLVRKDYYEKTKE